METTHFTNLGLGMQPRCADSEGYLHYREDAESLTRDEQTEAERLVFDVSAEPKRWKVLSADGVFLKGCDSEGDAYDHIDEYYRGRGCYVHGCSR